MNNSKYRSPAYSAGQIFISANTSWNILNFRANLIKSLTAMGFSVTAIAPDAECETPLRQLGCDFKLIRMHLSGTNPFREFVTLIDYWRQMWTGKPAFFLGFTPKTNIYGGFAARILGHRRIPNISGLGTAFISKTWLTTLVTKLYRFSLKNADVVFFQNKDDYDLFLNSGIIDRSARYKILPGSGVDLKRFSSDQFCSPETRKTRKNINVLMIARLVYDKGVREYIEAARLLRKANINVQFEMLGFLGVENSTAVTANEVQAWVDDGLIIYHGSTQDVRPYILAADCVVLPSYREGTPRSLLEAQAMGRPVITTNVPGCREVVRSGHNGYLCAARDAKDLASKIAQFVKLEPHERVEMGQRARAFTEQNYDENIVIESYRTVLTDSYEN